MKKIIFLCFILFFTYSCYNGVTKVHGDFEILEELPPSSDGDSGNGDNTFTYTVHTPRISLNGSDSGNVWSVKEGDRATLETIWKTIITSFEGGQTLAYSPSYSFKAEQERAYFDSSLNIVSATSKEILKKYKGAIIVKVNGDRGDLYGKYTVAGVYQVVSRDNDLGNSQSVGSDEAIFMRYDKTLESSKYKDTIYYMTQFLYTLNSNIEISDSKLLVDNLENIGTFTSWFFVKKSIFN